MLAGGIVVSLVAVWKGPDDLQAQAERTLRLAGTAERAELARSGRYTTRSGASSASTGASQPR